MFDSMESNPWDDAEQIALKAYELYENGDYSDALERMEEAIEINPENVSWLFNAGLTLDAMNNFKAAIRSYEAALELKPDDPEIMNTLAIDYTRTGMYDLALDVFERIEKIDPTFEPCYCNRIIAYAEIDRHDLAEQMFYLAQQIEPDCPICFYNIGNSLFSQRKFKRAIWCWQKTAKLDPSHPQINFRIAQAYWAHGEKDQAKKYFLAELRSNPGDTVVLLDFGLFLLECGDIEAAKEKFGRILEIEPDSARARLYLGDIALTSGNTQKAAEFYFDAADEDPLLSGPRFRLAQIAFAEEKYEKTLQLLENEMRLRIEDPDVIMSIGSMLLKIGAYDSAMDSFLSVVDEDPSNSRAFYYMGKTLAIQGELEGAGYFLEHALELGCKEPELRLDMAKLYCKSGKLDEADVNLRQYRELDSDPIRAELIKRQIRKTALRKKIRASKLGPVIENIQMLSAKFKLKNRRPPVNNQEQ